VAEYRRDIKIKGLAGATGRTKKNQPLVRAGGISALATSLRKIGDEELSKEMKAVTKAAAEKILPHAKKRVPVQTGRLRDSLKAEGTRRYARIKAGSAKRVPYARAIHSGRYIPSTGQRTRGTPFIRKAIPEAWPQIVDEFVKGMNRIARKFEKKHGASRVVGRFKK